MIEARRLADEFVQAALCDEQRPDAYAQAYKSLIEPIHESFPGLESSLRAEIEGKLERLHAAISRTTAPSDRSSYTLAACSVCALRNPANWRMIGPGVVPQRRLLDILDRAIDVAPISSNAYRPIINGIFSYIRGFEAEALDYFSGATDVMEFSGQVKDCLRGASTCRPLPESVFLAEGRLSTTVGGEIEWLRRSQMTSAPAVYSFSCDDVYFRAFGSNIVRSLVRHTGSPVDLHFHIINFDPQQSEETLSKIVSFAEGHRVSIHVSTEATAGATRTYFACARFFKINAFLREFNRDVLMSDMDIEFTSDARAYLSRFDATKIAVVLSRGPYWGFLPWRHVWAGHIYFPCNDYGILFSDILSRSLSYLWREEAHLSWWVDQTSLWLSKWAMEKFGLGSYIVDWPHYAECIKSSEQLKIAGLKNIETIGAAMAHGADWHSALLGAQGGTVANPIKIDSVNGDPEA